MTRYGFAIKALPKGKPPFGDDEDQDDSAAPAEESPDAGAPPDAIAPDMDPSTADAAAAPDTDVEAVDDPEQVPPTDDGARPEGGDADGPPPAPKDDARPWSGDMYDEGDETDPTAAFASYKGASGEEAWLDQAPDGTLTGWVRDATGQVWRYSDPDVWAIDVDDAQMTRAHSQATDGGDAPADHGGQDSLFAPKQSEET
ncbi:hypothetical protein [Streptomyces sp. NPDC058657]|uniref:hypothetical protein n=1 Tax=unclassified Streptomyces TaxID=2593676 RepID=UPI003666BC95